MERLKIEPYMSSEQWSLLPIDLAMQYDSLQEHFSRHFKDGRGWDSQDNMRKSHVERQDLRDVIARRAAGSYEVLLRPSFWPDVSEIKYLRMSVDWGNLLSLSDMQGVFTPTGSEFPESLQAKLRRWTHEMLSESLTVAQRGALIDEHLALLSEVRWWLAGDYWIDDEVF